MTFPSPHTRSYPSTSTQHKTVESNTIQASGYERTHAQTGGKSSSQSTAPKYPGLNMLIRAALILDPHYRDAFYANQPLVMRKVRKGKEKARDSEMQVVDPLTHEATSTIHHTKRSRSRMSNDTHSISNSTHSHTDETTERPLRKKCRRTDTETARRGQNPPSVRYEMLLSDDAILPGSIKGQSVVCAGCGIEVHLESRKKTWLWYPGAWWKHRSTCLALEAIGKRRAIPRKGVDY